MDAIFMTFKNLSLFFDEIRSYFRSNISPFFNIDRFQFLKDLVFWARCWSSIFYSCHKWCQCCVPKWKKEKVEKQNHHIDDQQPPQCYLISSKPYSHSLELDERPIVVQDPNSWPFHCFPVLIWNNCIITKIFFPFTCN